MQKTLFLLRHAKSDHDTQESDIDRPIAPKGVKDCTMMGQYCKLHLILPEMILCSDALRTKQTTQHVFASFSPAPAITYDHGLYLATPGEILKIIAKVPASVRSLMIVAHHPGLQQLATFLSGPPRKETLDLHRHYPTAALAIFSVNSESWQQIDSSVADFKDFVYP